MKDKSIGLVILLWVELIVSARILMFTVPVLISRYFKSGATVNTPADWCVFTISLIAMFYFLVGLASLLGHKQWKLFHYGGVILTAILTAGLVSKIVLIEFTVNPFYLVPFIVSLFLAVVIGFSKNRPKTI